jgi:hypothetical protein
MKHVAGGSYALHVLILYSRLPSPCVPWAARLNARRPAPNFPHARFPMMNR